jgi:uncharacterized protein YggE
MPIVKHTLAALVLTVAALVAAAVALPAHGDAAPVSEQGVVVGGTGTVTTVPDRGAFSFTVTSPAKTAVAALQANATAARAVAAALRQAGVAAADLQTMQASLDPRLADDGQTVTGYVATTTVTAQLRSLDRAGAVVDAAVAAGADGFSGPSLSTGDTAALYADALKAAIADARAKAQTMAAAAGLTLGRITSVQEAGAQPVVPFASAAKQDSVQIEPGTQDVQAAVTVTFAAS